MNLPTAMALIGCILTFLGSLTSLLYFVFKAGRLVKHLELSAEKIDKSTTKLDQIALHEQKLNELDKWRGQVERMVEGLSQRVQTLWDRLFSTDKRLAVTEERVRMQSQHDLSEEARKK